MCQRVLCEPVKDQRRVIHVLCRAFCQLLCEVSPLPCGFLVVKLIDAIITTLHIFVLAGWVDRGFSLAALEIRQRRVDVSGP